MHEVVAVGRFVTSSVDGGNLEVFSSGYGPGVVVVVGGGTDANTYRRLAERLSGRFTVHRYNRRGRGQTVARPDDYELATEIGDLGSVLSETGSTRVIGHSIGGFIAFAAAQRLPIERLGLFDPAISIDGLFPSAFIPEFERLIAEGDSVNAMVVMGKGLQNPGAGLPVFVQRAAVKLLLLTPPGRTMADLLPTVPGESHLSFDADGPATQWSNIGAATRFFIGERSPAYYEPIARKLAGAMAQADVEMVPRHGHDAIARASSQLVESLAHFLS